MKNRLTNSKVLVTGGAGFIGSNLIASLLQSGNKVICLDNFSTGRHENIYEFKGNPLFTLIEGDIRNYDDCFQAVKEVDIVFHQAALGSVPRSLKDPATSTDVNIGGFVRMLTASKDSGVGRFIYAASSSTYGDNEELPKLEEKIGNPPSPHAVTKYADVNFSQESLRLIMEWQVIGLRYFNVYGPKAAPWPGLMLQLFQKFASSAEAGENDR
ncbi:MAG: NAD-dependent epimerase/dehydratase family protein [Marinilabiliales bacterium]|nr:NAD-dependent epimerase/dehydratase family protein [Marinilabiliales bacterium]